MKGGAAWLSTTVSDSCPTAGGTYETRPVSGERSVQKRSAQRTVRHCLHVYESVLLRVSGEPVLLPAALYIDVHQFIILCY